MRRRSILLASLAIALLLSACDARVRGPSEPCFSTCFDDGGAPPPPPGAPPRALPPLIRAESSPPPLSGGNLLVVGDRAVVADTDRDQLHLIDLPAPGAPTLVTTTALEPGDEPGRVVADESGHLYVALRGGDAVAHLDESLELVERYQVCSSPRGVDTYGTTLYVACLEGDLVTIDTTSGEELSRASVGDDLRDVIVTDERIYVSHFRSAEITVMVREGTARRVTLEIETEAVLSGRRAFVPALAYRMIEHDGRILVLHQLASPQRVDITTEGGYGGGFCDPIGSEGLVQAAVTTIEGATIVNSVAAGSLVIPVDLAVESSTDRLAIAAYGSRIDGFTPFASPGVAMASAEEAMAAPFLFTDCGSGIEPPADGRRSMAVAFHEGRTLALTRAPTSLVILETEETLDLPGPDVYDVGHDLFYGDSGSGIACASCHAEGGDDGLVWNFSGIGGRRTQDLRGGILGTEPFHWDGDMADFQHLSSEVFSGRMAGPELPSEYADALARYIDSVAIPSHGDGVDPLAAERGRQIFESAEAQCNVCHSGPRLSGPGSFDVGTGGTFQVPSLLGVSLRAPFIHSGCASTLEERFDPACGGALHGNVSHLTPQERGDLIAYLESI
jgi:hypothetical protein